ncbi:hypothetical protein pipiens_015572, partial [Culex pipiens pipiens]
VEMARAVLDEQFCRSCVAAYLHIFVRIHSKAVFVNVQVQSID